MTHNSELGVFMFIRARSPDPSHEQGLHLQPDYRVYDGWEEGSSTCRQMNQKGDMQQAERWEGWGCDGDMVTCRWPVLFVCPQPRFVWCLYYVCVCVCVFVRGQKHHHKKTHHRSQENRHKKQTDRDKNPHVDKKNSQEQTTHTHKTNRIQ